MASIISSRLLAYLVDALNDGTITDAMVERYENIISYEIPVEYDKKENDGPSLLFTNDIISFAVRKLVDLNHTIFARLISNKNIYKVMIS